MKHFTPNNLADIRYLSEPSLSPDGRFTAFTRYTVDLEKKTFEPRVLITNNQTGQTRQLCDQHACRAQYEKLGVYFLSDISGEHQVWFTDGGKPEQKTTFRHGVESFCVSPDGRIAAAVACWPDEEDLIFTEMSETEKTEWLEKRESTPVIIEDFMYKLDASYGLLDGSRTRIAIVAPGGGVCLIGDSTTKCSMPSFSPDGTKLAFYGKPYSGIHAEESEVFLFDGELVTQLTQKADVSPDCPACFFNGGIVFSAYKAHEDGGLSEWLFLVKDGDVKPLFSEDAPETCHSFYNHPIGRSVYGADGPLLGTANGYLYFLSCWQGDERVFRMLPDGLGLVEAVETGGLSVHAFCVGQDGMILYVGGDQKTPGELYRYSDGMLAQLTHENEWLNEYALAPVHRLELPFEGGKTDVWVMEPCSREPDRKYPAVLDIHGGPECCYVNDFWHEFRALSTAGIAVIWCNPRGGMGYGRRFSGSDLAWGEAAWNDLVGAVDLAESLGFIDICRVGVTGGSYGGYMTVKFISQSKRFCSAVGQRILCNTATSYGTGDMGFASSSCAPEKVDMREYLMKRAERSLIRNVDEIDVPLLLLHGYKDYRCGFEQSEQLFVALRERRPQLPVRLVMFPDENHGITRTGKPLSQIRHLTELNNWFVRYIAEEKSNDEKRI